MVSISLTPRFQVSCISQNNASLAHQARLRQIQSNDRRLVANVRMNDLSCPEHKQAPWACIPLASPRRTIHTYNTYYIQLLHPIAENFPSSLDIRYSAAARTLYSTQPKHYCGSLTFKQGSAPFCLIRVHGDRKPARSASRPHGERRFGSLGKRDVFRMLGRPQKSITTRSRPMPPPACGKAPYLKEST